MEHCIDIIPIPIVANGQDVHAQHDAQLKLFTQAIEHGYKVMNTSTMVVANVGYIVFVVEKIS